MRPNERDNGESGARVARPLTLKILGIIVGIEAGMLLAWTVWYVVGFGTDTPDSLPGALLLLVLSLVATVWLSFVTVGVFRRQTWTRAATLVWQLCLTAVAAGAFQGLYAAPLVGLGLLIPALAAGVLLFTPSVVEALRREPR